MAGDDQDQGPPAPRDPGRLSSAERDRLDALHQLAPLAGRRLLAVHAFLFEAAADAELETVAQAHEAQARQLRDPAIRRALRGAWQVVDPIRFIPGRGRPDLPLNDLLALAPPELAAAVRAELAAAGLDPDATDWPPPGPVVG
ncbi:MAG TPA: hypothetical protein VHM23_13360 [Actinomycetota bacterium]|jgi:hypothetical protein|nr:hypothetical protein [Actinomycetota bacterium]